MPARLHNRKGMLWGTDRYVGELTELFKSKGMYDNMLIVYSADK
jgi:arylsulfatase A-like enzyme